MLVHLYFLILVNLNLVLVCDMLLSLSSTNVQVCLVGILSWEYHYIYIYCIFKNLPNRLKCRPQSLWFVTTPRWSLYWPQWIFPKRRLELKIWCLMMMMIGWWWWWWWWWWWSSLLHYLGCTDCLSREKGAMIIVKGWWNDDTPE